MESHLTATGLVVNETFSKALMIFHKKLQIWLPAGGHVEPGELPHETVIREVFEETGISASIIDASIDLHLKKDREIQIPTPAWVLHEPIPAFKDKQAHMHYDFIYILQTESGNCSHAEREVEQAKWFTKEELLTIGTTEATRKMYLMVLGKHLIKPQLS